MDQESDASRLTVVHIVLSLEVGGLERVVLDLIREGVALGQNVVVICLEHPGALAPRARELGATVFSVGKPPGLKPAVVHKIAKLLRDLDADVVHTHQIGALLYSGPAARRTGVRLVVHTEHINNIAKPLTRWGRFKGRLLWRIAGRHAARFFCVSDDIALAARTVVTPSKIRVIPNGIDLSAFATSDGQVIRHQLGISPDVKVIGTVGRLNEVKCQDLLIRAFGRLRQRKSDSHLLLVGDGPARSSLEELVRSLSLSRHVTFSGYQSRPQEFLAAMDIFALPSRLEGMPLAILEAWASQVPVVATRVGGVPKMVEHERTGLLIDSGDEAALEAALRRLVDDTTLARGLAAAGRVQVESQFDSRRMARDYHCHYLELLGRAYTRPRTPALSDPV
jgi:sugar transferase (PEP-CTERM/EpsH1 system associated)